MKKVNNELLVLDLGNEVGSVNGYNAAVSAIGKNQVAIAAGTYSVASATGANSIAIATGQYSRASALKKDSLAIGWGGHSKSKRCARLLHSDIRLHRRPPRCPVKKSGRYQHYAGYLVFTD